MSVIEQPHVHVLDEKEVKKQREDIIREVGGDEKSFIDRAESFLLSEKETFLYSRLKGLDFLLDGK